MRGGEPEPFSADVVDVREDGGDRPSLAPGQFRAPCTGIEMLENDLIHPFVYCVTLHHYLAKVEHLARVEHLGRVEHLAKVDASISL